MTIFEELVQRVSDGTTFSINFEARTMKIGRRKIISNGEYDSTKELISFNGDVLQIIDELYDNFKYSLPSERSDSKRKSYFKALSVDELTDEQMVVGERREIAQAKLEGFILCAILTGKLTWNEPTMGKWFYQSKNDPDLVLLRNWIENKNN